MSWYPTEPIHIWCHLVIVLSAYLAAVVLCIIKDSPLISSQNRAGVSAIHCQMKVLISDLCRISCARAVICCLLICNQEFDLQVVPNVRTREWLQETEFHASDDGKRYLSWGMYTWCLMDLQPPTIWTPHHWSSERDVWHSFTLTTECRYLDTVETSSETVLWVVLLHPVGSIVSFPHSAVTKPHLRRDSWGTIYHVLDGQVDHGPIK